MYDEQNQNDNNVHIDSFETVASAQKQKFGEMKLSVCEFLFNDPDYDLLDLSFHNPRVFYTIVDFITLCLHVRSGNKL